MQNRDLINYGQNAYFWTFETIRILAVSVHQCLKTLFLKKLIDIGGLPRKCVYQAFIIQNLDVVTLELGMKVQFADI
jgi:hypothetical protein